MNQYSPENVKIEKMLVKQTTISRSVTLTIGASETTKEEGMDIGLSSDFRVEQIRVTMFNSAGAILESNPLRDQIILSIETKGDDSYWFGKGMDIFTLNTLGTSLQWAGKLIRKDVNLLTVRAEITNIVTPRKNLTPLTIHIDFVGSKIERGELEGKAYN